MIKGIQITFGLMLSAVVLAGCSSNDVQRHADLQPIEATTQANVLWSTKVGSGSDDFYSRLQPVYEDGVLYVADRHGLIVALSAEDGSTIWERELSEDGRWFGRLTRGESARISAGPKLVDDTLYIPSENGFLFALDKTNGETKWSAQLRGELVSEPAVGEGFVVAHLGNGFIVALDAEDGSPVWEYEEETALLGLRGTSTPTIVSGGVVLGTATGKGIVLLLDGGRLAWEQRVSAPTGSSELERMVDVDGSPLVAGSNVYMSAFNGETISLALMSGEIEWKRDYASARQLQLLRNRLLVVTQEGHVISADRFSGNERWRNSDLYYRSVTEPALQGNYFVVGDRFGYLHWLSIDSGEIEGRLLLNEDDQIHTAPVAVEDNIAVQTASGRVYLIETR
ncbi:MULTISPECIES: outer membrane protein assembly factor BamB [Gammaproteobacteria]|uniref:outer membrane protein assembly factor BamB n=1 Tax=Gammaproteobacteria TaxID=1236 RepID=UPI000DD0D578|nr:MULTISPECIES: outer membrane protein assembly factor BamB [Gammaproteobacteria]RTE86209.1 outer membrane protein assembly factor BamB [Aliidiomarina sp. B3213]TCZ91561.1 outer membrane protein assembly factor BamB [Lysobacter sp. N42]